MENKIRFYSLVYNYLPIHMSMIKEKRNLNNKKEVNHMRLIIY